MSTLERHKTGSANPPETAAIFNLSKYLTESGPLCATMFVIVRPYPPPFHLKSINGGYLLRRIAQKPGCEHSVEHHLVTIGGSGRRDDHFGGGEVTAPG